MWSGSFASACRPKVGLTTRNAEIAELGESAAGPYQVLGRKCQLRWVSDVCASVRTFVTVATKPRSSRQVGAAAPRCRAGSRPDRRHLLGQSGSDRLEPEDATGEGRDLPQTDRDVEQRATVPRHSDRCWRPDFLRLRVGMYLPTALARPHAGPLLRCPARGRGPSCSCLPVSHDHGANRQLSPHVGDRDEPCPVEGRREHRGVPVHREHELATGQDWRRARIAVRSSRQYGD